MDSAVADLFPISAQERERFLAQQKHAKKDWKAEANSELSGLALLLDADYEEWLSEAPEARVDQLGLFNSDQLEPAIPEWTEDEVMALHEFILKRLGTHLNAHWATDHHKRLVWRWFMTIPDPGWKEEGVPPFSFHACCLCSDVDAETLQSGMIHAGKEQFIKLFGEDKYRVVEPLVTESAPGWQGQTITPAHTH